MRQLDLKNMTIDALVTRYVEIGVAQDEALLDEDIKRFNRLFDIKTAIVDELKARSGDQRHALMSLYDHPNAQVRLNAAKSTLAIAPKRARRKLQEIADSQEHPQAGDAGMSLWALDKGIFKPA